METEPHDAAEDIEDTEDTEPCQMAGREATPLALGQQVERRRRAAERSRARVPYGYGYIALAVLVRLVLAGGRLAAGFF